MSIDQRLFVFGPGEIFAVLNQYYDGTSPTVPQPFRLDVDQDLPLDFTSTPKELWGQSIFPTAIGLGEGKVTGKIRQGRVDYRMIQALFAAQDGQPTTGMNLTYQQGYSTVVPGSPYQITPAPPNSGVYVADWGVRYANSGLFLTKVTGPVAQGEYAESAGEYTFAALDTTQPIIIDYEFSVATGYTISYDNPLQGAVGFMHMRYQGSYGGRYIGIDLPLLVPNKFSLATKQKDWVMPEFDFSLFSAPSGLVASIFTTE